LFVNYLYEFSKVRRFYADAPFVRDWWGRQAASIRYEDERRARVAAILERQNRAFGSGEGTFTQIQHLREGAAAVVTGQQVGLFGGPLFSILKALTAVRIAEEATRAGVPSVPVFWLATEDHDLAEVNHLVFPGPEASLLRVETPTRSTPDAPVGSISFGAEIETAGATVTQLLGSEAASRLQDSYRPGVRFGEAFARWFAWLFREGGVVLLDAAEPELHSLAVPLYRQAAERVAELHARLEARGRELQAGGFHEQVKVTPTSTLLFVQENGTRTPVHRFEGQFTIGERKLTGHALLERIRSVPEQFSPNVLLRPVVQDFLLPTLAYIGGPAEIAYFAQAACVYEVLLGRVTPVLPRLSATLVEAPTQRLLERYHLKVSDIFAPQEQVRQILADRVLPSDLQTNFDAALASLDQSLGAITRSLRQLDPTLADAAENAGSKMRYQLEHLHTRAAHAALRRNEVLTRHAAALQAALYPQQSLQERVIAGAYYVARYPDLLAAISQAASFTCPGHQVIYL
jgi:bacillithiol biosynthesis cysteine-adding enzyme BshC